MAKRANDSDDGVKLVRGSGPPMLTAEGGEIGIADSLYVVTPDRWRPTRPIIARVIGIDLTRRTVLLQTDHGSELLHSPDGSNHRARQYWLFSTAELATTNYRKMCAQAIKDAERKADEALADLEKAKKEYADADKWIEQQDRQTGDG